MLQYIVFLIQVFSYSLLGELHPHQINPDTKKNMLPDITTTRSLLLIISPYGSLFLPSPLLPSPKPSLEGEKNSTWCVYFLHNTSREGISR